MLTRLLTSAALLLAVVPAARAADGVRWTHTPQGDPLLSPTASDGAYLTWWVCPPSEACRAALSPAGSAYFTGDARLAPGASARGTFFETDGFVGKAEVRERSPMWLGRVAVRRAPRVTGTLRVGQPVRPEAAAWSGGWADDAGTLALVACPASARASCEYLTTKRGAVTGSGARTLRRKHRGWHVYAVEHRRAADDAVPDLKAGPAPRPVASTLVAVSRKRGLVRSAS